MFFKKGLRSANLLKKRLRHKFFSCTFCETSENTFSYRIPLVAASGYSEQFILSRTFLLFRVSSLYPVEDFCYSVKVIYGTEHLLSAILSKLYWVEHFCYSKLVIQKMFMLSRNFLQFCVV